MKVLKKPQEVTEQVMEWKREGKVIGLVPTMGYLHEGHISLIKKAVEECDKVVVSDFVNPIQFGPGEDLASYPRDLEKDCKACEEAGADLVLAPEPEDMYEDDFCTYVDMDGLTKGLCGKTRPTHFRGVCTVVSKLFHIAQPDRAYFGQKDAQQLAVIRRMVRDLSFPITIVGCPIVREEDGLAKSSRNTYLSPEERQAALCLSRGLQAGKAIYLEGERTTAPVIQAIQEVVEKEPLARIDYIEAVDAVNMEPVSEIKKDVLVAMAVYVGTTRLIDNMLLVP